MHPIIFEWGDAVLQSYTLMAGLAFMVGLVVWVFEGRRQGLKPDSLVNLTLIAGASGWAGARVLFVITQWPRYLNGEFHLFYLWEGGVVFLGGFIAAALTLYALMPRFGVPRRTGFDTAAPAICFAHAVGRVGCFLNGCCFGDHCELPWAVTYTHPLSAAPLNTPLHPTQLYEAMGLVALGAVLLWVNRHPLKRLSTTQLYLAGYGLLRFLAEFTRGDALRGSWAGLSTSQWLSLALIFAALLLDFRGRNSHNSRHHES